MRAKYKYAKYETFIWQLRHIYNFFIYSKQFKVIWTCKNEYYNIYKNPLNIGTSVIHKTYILS